MLEQPHNDSLASKLASLPQYVDFQQEIKDMLTPDDLKIFGQMSERRIAEGLASLGVLAPAPASFDFDAFRAVCAHDLSPQQAEKLMEIAIKTGLVTKDEKTGRYKLAPEVGPILEKYLEQSGL